MQGDVTTPGVEGHRVRQRAWEKNSARDGVTEGGKGRSDGPLPSQAQHAADHATEVDVIARHQALLLGIHATY